MLPTVYDRFADPNDAITQIGEILNRCGFCGCERQEQGQFLALAMMCERKSPLQIQRQYHIYDGQLTPKTRWCLAELRKAGGDFDWLTDSDDVEKATIQLTKPNGKQCRPVTVTIDDAKKSLHPAMFTKPGSAWVKTPAIMLQIMAARRALARDVPEFSMGDDPDDRGEAIPAPSSNIEEVTANPLGGVPAVDPPPAPPAKPKAAKPKSAVAKAKAAAVDAEEVPPNPAPAPVAPPPPQVEDPDDAPPGAEMPPTAVTDAAADEAAGRPAPEPEEEKEIITAPDPNAKPSWNINSVTDGAKNGEINAAAEKAIIGVLGAAADKGMDWLLRKQWLKEGQTLRSLAPARAVKILTDSDRFRKVILQ